MDREKLRATVSRLEGEDLRVLLDRAIDLLPEPLLEPFIRDYARPAELRFDGAVAPTLLERVERFCTASLAGEYYESFDVNSRNYRMKSPGTQRFIADCHRHLERCAEATLGGALVEARGAYDRIFLLLAQVDQGKPDIVFFGDEHGSEQIGVHWAGVLPVWFGCVAATASSAETYAATVHRVVEYFAHYEWDRLLPEASRVANAAQRAALERMPRPTRSYKPLVLLPWHDLVLAPSLTRRAPRARPGAKAPGHEGQSTARIASSGTPIRAGLM
jgi:hypothetical protein